MSTFNLADIPSQSGRIAIVTGANTGLGYETALALAQKEMTVVMACRNLDKAEAAKQEILKKHPNATLDIIPIDLSKLDSVRTFATSYLAKYDQLDLLINNAGVMIPPYQKTEDGFELQMGANYFGHFLLTGLLLGALENTPDSRVVTLSSNAHKSGKINFDDLQSEEKYSRIGAYAQSKLACLMFAFELQRRLERAGSNTLSLAAHPGVSVTELVRHIPRWVQILLYPFVPLVTHSAKKGALPTLNAALAKDAKGGEYYGPQGFNEMKGKPGLAKIANQAKDEAVARRLWEVSQDLTGIKYLDIPVTS